MSIWYAFFSYAIISCLPVFVSSSFNFCNYGEYFKNNKCYVCEEDSYSSHRNSESCFSCPPSSFNKKRTSKFIYDCTCDNNYYLDYVGNRCDLCSYINNHFYCKKNLNELHVDNLESFFKHKNEISFKNFDRCSVKQKKKNIYPFMNNMYIYCKRPYVCLDTCGKCAEKNEGFICNNCIKNYYKNIYVKYAKCKKCYHIIFIIFITMIYCILSLIFFMVLFKCINISLYFYHFDIYEKGTIYFLHYFREFMFYLSLILLLSFSNDLTENERENYTLYEKENKGGLYLHKGNLKAHYFLNIYLHNAFYDLIKIVHLNFLHFIKLDCFHFYSNRSKIYMLQILVFVWIVFLFTCFTLVFNFIFLYLRKGAKNMILEERGNKSESLNNNKIKRIKNFYAKYVRIKKDGSTTENRENMDNSLTVNFYFYYYLKNKMNVNLFHFDEGTTDFSKRHIDEVFLKNYEVVTMKPRRAISKKDIGYIYHSCVLISPFIAETIIQLLFITKNINHIIRLRTNNPHVKIYNFLFENGYIEIQKTAIDRFITKAICIYKQVFKGNYFLFRSEMISVFTDIVRNLRCFKDVYIRECIANRIREKYKINEVDKNKMIYDENYEQKHINTFLYKLRRLDKNVDRKNQEFFQLFPNIGHVVLKKVNGGRKKKKRRNA
ncbi:hypothetical protein MKS88_003096 [Plasmodium brasilianum]|uniref:Uncharacterized protein n=1 Tax=Plasmodium brasilianum TaxID=5824 RepID=A0ACB9Y7Y7_PLABR|nr:hypothetical protein MKS88_003096 [Plasmodium brasilianum]